MHIQSFARLMNVTPRTLRFYEEKGLLQPIKDEENGYRTYSMDDAFRLQTILSLREAGLTLPEIREVLEKLDQGNKRELLRDLELQRAALTTQWLDLRDRLKTTERMIQLLQTGSVQWSDIHELTVGARRMREVRQKWQDSWGFNQWADHFDVEVEDRWPGYEELLQATVDAVELSHGSMGLEVGVGTGNLCAKLIEAGATMVGIDPSMAMLDQCRRKLPRMATKLGNALAIPYDDQAFDFVVASFVFRHLNEEQQKLAILEMTRVLQPEGRLYISDSVEHTRKLSRLMTDVGYEVKSIPVRGALHVLKGGRIHM